jgi:hypothetical protein
VMTVVLTPSFLVLLSGKAIEDLRATTAVIWHLSDQTASGH